MRLRLTEAAERDMAEIAAWLTAETSEAVARRLVGDLLQRLEAVLAFPESGSPRERVRPGLRAVLRHNYAMYYRIEGDLVAVIRVLHGARDTAAIAESGGFEG
ncbi:MAG: type II toxin-antitoxin system RelE/ParE family toxin [Beijerinckiaceae bacterium]